MTARFAPEELDGLLDLLFYTSKTADGDDAEFYRTIADKLDAMVHENGLLCEHENLEHKTDAEPEQVELADFCPDCLVDYDCECDTE
jgi:hypothetical protein